VRARAGAGVRTCGAIERKRSIGYAGIRPGGATIRQGRRQIQRVDAGPPWRESGAVTHRLAKLVSNAEGCVLLATNIAWLPEVGGLHHRYVRRVA